MVQSNHFSSELTRASSDQLDGVLPCVPGVHGPFDLTAEARYSVYFILGSLVRPKFKMPAFDLILVDAQCM